MNQPSELEIPKVRQITLRVISKIPSPCEDLDEDCKYVEDKRVCYRHDPKGYCPFLIGER